MSSKYTAHKFSKFLWCFTSALAGKRLTFKGRMLDISNTACTPQWPNVRYI